MTLFYNRQYPYRETFLFLFPFSGHITHWMRLLTMEADLQLLRFRRKMTIHKPLNQRYCMESWDFSWPSKAQFCFLLYLECHTASHYCCCCRKVILLCASIINIKSNHNLFTSHNTLPKARTNLVSSCQNLRAHILR